MGVGICTPDTIHMATPMPEPQQGPFEHLTTQRDKSLLVALMLLGARSNPDLGASRDQMVLESSPKARITALLVSAILEDARIFSSRATLFHDAAEAKWSAVRLATFTDNARMAQILEAADPRGLVWPDICGCSSLTSWLEHGDCKMLVRQLLAECNIDYTLHDRFILIDGPKLFNSLACIMLVQPQVDSLYATLFSTETLRAIADSMQRIIMDVSNGQPKEEFAKCLKLLLGFVGVFFGTGLIMGKAMS